MHLKILLVSLFFLALLPVTTPAQAQVFEGGGAQNLFEQDQAFLGSAGLGTEVRLSRIISQIIKVVLSFLGVIFIVLVIYAGFTWMTSAGNEEKIGRAKKTMVASIIGLTIILAAYLITFFVIDQLLEATKGGVGLD